MNSYTLPSGIMTVEKIDGGFTGNFPKRNSERNDALFEALGELWKAQNRQQELERVNAPNLLQMAKGIQYSIDFYRKNSDNKVKGHIEYGILGKRPVDNPDAIPISILERDIYALRKQAKGGE